MAAGQGPSRETGTQDPARPPGGPDGLIQQPNLPAVQGASPNRQPTPLRKTSGNALKDLESRAANAETPAEALEWAHVRREISQQQQDESEPKRRFWAGVTTACVSMAILTSGTVLTLHGQQQVGVFVIGAGIYGIAPEYVVRFFGRILGGGR